MKIAIASDHAGFQMNEDIKNFLKKIGHQTKDYGTFDKASVDYPEFAVKVAEAVSKREADKGILFCGTGLGMSIVANKVPGIRAALCYDKNTAELSRKHNDANVLTIGARIIQPEKAKEIVYTWLKTDFEGERHSERIEKIKEIEDKFQGLNLLVF